MIPDTHGLRCWPVHSVMQVPPRVNSSGRTVLPALSMRTAWPAWASLSAEQRLPKPPSHWYLDVVPVPSHT
ncbi:hypothetical protein ADK53_06920 [Streptomyces sp. WM6373]|nr:hypothetical protein ADK53_06920 [Streptomyces sp. WM6373]KOU84152.1 hypothetical protein ADK93_25975 [Streptomyces sp. XY58]